MPPTPSRLRDIRGAVRFERVSFAYEPGDLVLEDISLDVSARRDDRPGGTDRRRQNDHHQLAKPLL